MIIDLYIMRHGEAEPYSANDKMRKLTSRGHAEAKLVGEHLTSCIQSVDHAFVSSYVRAQQTAEELFSVLGEPLRKESLDDLIPSGNAVNFHDYFDAIVNEVKPASVVIVSHMPLVSYLVEEFSIQRACPVFATASVARIEYDTTLMKGHLKSMVSPHDIV